MPRLKKDGVILNCKIDKKVAEELEKFVTDTGLSKTAAVERALAQYIKNYRKSGKI